MYNLMNKFLTPKIRSMLNHAAYALLGGAVSVFAYMATQGFANLNYADITTAFFVGAGLLTTPNLAAVRNSRAQVTDRSVAPEGNGNPPVPQADGSNASEFPGGGK